VAREMSSHPFRRPRRRYLAETNKASAAAAASTIPQPVQDYITLAGLDLTIIQRFSTEDKALNNYLSTRSAQITGDFLTYWKQKAGTEQTVTLQVRHQRSPQGVQQLAFYVHDQTDQYPEQRSKGFLWFLSFYLRLAAEHQRSPDRERMLLIDEPGTYLHARAQQDVLHLLEDRENVFSYASNNSSNFPKTESRPSRCTRFSSSFNVGLVFDLMSSSSALGCRFDVHLLRKLSQ
jgi:hypothetical protein